MNHECHYADDIKEIKSDVKTLLEFKWRMSGGYQWIAVIASGVLSFAAIAVSLLEKAK